MIKAQLLDTFGSYSITKSTRNNLAAQTKMVTLFQFSTVWLLVFVPMCSSIQESWTREGNTLLLKNQYTNQYLKLDFLYFSGRSSRIFKDATQMYLAAPSEHDTCPRVKVDGQQCWSVNENEKLDGFTGSCIKISALRNQSVTQIKDYEFVWKRMGKSGTFTMLNSFMFSDLLTERKVCLHSDGDNFW